MNRYPKHEHEYERDYGQVLCIHCGATQPTAPPNCPKCGHGWAKHDGRDERLPNQPCCTQYAGMGESCGCEEMPPAALVAQGPPALSSAQGAEDPPQWLEEAYGAAMDVLASYGVDDEDNGCAIDAVDAALPILRAGIEQALRAKLMQELEAFRRSVIDRSSDDWNQGNFDAQLAVKHGYLTFNTPRGTP